MSPIEARALLHRESNGLLEVAPVELASHLVALVCAVRPIPSSAFEADGMARFACKMNRPMWEAVKTLVDAHFKIEGSQ